MMEKLEYLILKDHEGTQGISAPENYNIKSCFTETVELTTCLRNKILSERHGKTSLILEAGRVTDSKTCMLYFILFVTQNQYANMAALLPTPLHHFQFTGP